MTPLSAGLLLTLLLAGARGPAYFPAAAARGGTPLVLAAFSNQFYAAYLPVHPHSHLNAWQSAKLGWTNGGTSFSSIRAFPRAGTNLTRW